MLHCCLCSLGVLRLSWQLTKSGVVKEENHKRCVHFYACICAFASDEKLTEEFRHYIHLDMAACKAIIWYGNPLSVSYLWLSARLQYLHCSCILGILQTHTKPSICTLTFVDGKQNHLYLGCDRHQWQTEVNTLLTMLDSHLTQAQWYAHGHCCSCKSPQYGIE